MKIIFMGTPSFGVPSLEILHESGYDVVAVVTQPDKSVGRGERVVFSAVKEYALKNGLRVLQYDKVSRDGVCELRALSPDLMVTAAFGQLLSQEVLDIAKHGVLNVHASLLPKYRGAAPIQAAIINGERTTGVTIMRTVLALDSGDILIKKSLGISDDETAGELFIRLSRLGAEALIEGVKAIENGTAAFMPQDHTQATYCKTIKKQDALINFDTKSKDIVNFVRGMNPSPTAFAVIKGENVKVFCAEATKGDGGACCSVLDKQHDIIPQCTKQHTPLSPFVESGTIIFADSKNGLVVKTADSAVRLKQIGFPNRKRMSDVEYFLGVRR